MSSSATTAAVRVLDTAELLELVLTQKLSPSDVTTARGVNNFFKAVIDNSKKLSCARVLGNKPLLEQILGHLKATTDVVKARQINSYFSEVIDESKKLRPILYLEPKPVCAFITVPDPNMSILDPRSLVYSRDMVAFGKDKLDKVLMEIHPALSLVSANTGFRVTPDGFSTDLKPREITSWVMGGLWESMLICQPPCEEFQLTCVQGVRCECGYGGRRVVRGNTLGALRNALLHWGACGALKTLRIHGYKDQNDWIVQYAQDLYWESRESGNPDE